MILIFFSFIFVLLFSVVFSNPCTIFAKNEPNYTQSNISNLTYKGSQVFPYNSFLEAISGIKYCEINITEVNIYLLSDFYTISSYEINIMREKDNALFYVDEYNIFYLFKDLQPNIRSLLISYYMKEGNAQISLKDQNISFQIDRTVTFKNINFTGIDINLDFNADIHQDCFFDKIECCLLYSCFKQFQILNISSFNQHGLFILEAGTIYLYEVTFFFFESYQLTKNPTYNALFTSRNSGSRMHVYDTYFSDLFFVNGIILIKELNDSNMVNATFNQIAVRENMKVPCFKLISLEKISNFNFKNIIIMNSDVLTLFSFNYSNVQIINMTLVQSIFQNTNIFLIVDNCRTFFTNVLLKNLNFSILLKANSNNKLIIQNVFVHNVSLKNKDFIVAYNSNLIYFENFHIKELKDAFYLIYLFRKNSLHFVRGNWEQIYLTNSSLPSNKIEGALFLIYLNNLSLANSIFQKIFINSLNYIFMRSDNIIIIKKMVIFKFSSINNGVFICTNESNSLILQKNTFIDGVTEKSGYFDIDYSEMSLKDCQFLNGTTGAYAIIYLLHTYLYVKNVSTSNISFKTYNVVKPIFLLTISSIFLIESSISSINNPGISFIYTESQSFISVFKLKISKCVFNLIYGRYDNVFQIKVVEFLDFNILKILLLPLNNYYNKLFISNLFLDRSSIYIPNFYRLYFYISNCTFFNNQNEVIKILFSVGQNSFIMIKKCSFYDFFSVFELLQNNSLIIIFTKFYCRSDQPNSILSADQNNILILKNSLIYGQSSNLLSKGQIIINKFNKLKLVKTDINFKFVTNENGKELHYFIFFDISMWNIFLVLHCKISIKQSSYLLNSIFQNWLVFQNVFFDIKLQVKKSFAIINVSHFFFKNSSIFNNTSNFIDGRDSWIKFEKINIENYEKKLIMCKVCSIIIENLKSSGENVKSSLFIELVESNFYFKKSTISFINVQEETSILKIHNCKILIKKCMFHNINLQNIRANFMDLNHFDNILFFKKCTFVMNRNLASLIHLNRSRNDRIYFFSNILKLQLSYGVLLKINNSTANAKFFKNYLIIFDLVNFRSFLSPKGLIFITDSYGSISFFNNTFERMASNKLIFIEPHKDEENLNFMVGSSDSKNIKIQTEYTDAYFIDELLQTKNKSCILHKVQLGKEYSNCLCAIHLFDSLDMPYYDINIKFQEIFEIEQTKQGNVNEFTFGFSNVAGKFCLLGKFEMMKLYSIFEVSKLQITFHQKQILQPLLLIIDFQILCSQYQYMDINGNCRFCPMNYFPLSTFGDTLLNKNSLNSKSNCQLCDKDNPFYCFGGEKISPKPNFWQSGADSSIVLRCPYDSSCRGDDRRFLSDNFVYKELYTLGFCLKNSKGILCSDCKVNYGRWFEEECESCFLVRYSIFLFFQILIKFIICLRVLYFSIKFFLVSDDYDGDEVLGKESKIILHYESFNTFIQLMNSFVFRTSAVKLEIFRFLLRLTLLFSSNLDFAIPYECFFRNEEIKKQNLFLKLVFILTTLICTFLLLFRYMRRNICSKTNIFGKAQVFKFVIIIILSKCLNLFSYNLIEFCTKSFFYLQIKSEDKQKYFTIFLYGFKYELMKDYFSFHIQEFIILFSIIAIMCVLIILEVLSMKEFLYFKMFKLIFPLFLTITLNYLKLVKLSNYRNLNNLLNLTCFLILIYLLLMMILKPKNKIVENFYKKNNVKFYLSFLLFIILYNISILQEDLQRFFDAIYSIFFFFIVFSEILFMKNIDKVFYQFFNKKKKQVKIKISRKNMKNISKHNKMIEESITKNDCLLDHRIYISSKNRSFKRNFNKFREKISSLLFLRKIFRTRLVSQDLLMEFANMINNPKSFFRHFFILNCFHLQENIEFCFELQKLIFIQFLVKREWDHIDIFYCLDSNKRSVTMCDNILIIAQIRK